MKRKPSYGDFGNIAEVYDKVRRDYPKAVTDFVLGFLPKVGGQKILDVGCGTGISTRRIFKNLKSGEIVGCDKDLKMLAIAKKYPEKITYIEASAEKMPNVIEEKFNQIEKYMLDEAIDRYKSKSISNLVPKNLKEKVYGILRQKFAMETQNGFVPREVEIRVVVGQKVAKS